MAFVSRVVSTFLRPRIKCQNALRRSIASTTCLRSGEGEVRDETHLVLLQSKPTIFDKIISKEIPADIIYEDENCLAFNDISPQAPVHFLIIPKVRIPRLEDVNKHDREILGRLLEVAAKLGKEKAPKGFRTVINNGRHGCQTVFHIHVHVLGGRQLKWPPG